MNQFFSFHSPYSPHTPYHPHHPQLPHHPCATRHLLSFLTLFLPLGLLASPLLGGPGGSVSGGSLLSFHNATTDQRHEVVEVEAAKLYKQLGVKAGTPLVVKDKRGNEVTTQLTYDGKLLVDADVRPMSTTTYTVAAGQPKQYRQWVYGRLVPERKDDIAWENDRGAYRIYGPALEKTGERSFGTDVWVKNTPDLVIDDRYAGDEKGISYHVDHGTGYDPYDVGPTLGCGAPGLLIDGKLKMPYCWKSYEILDKGPLRFTVRADYGNEHRLISLDKGSNFNRMTVWYDKLPTGAQLTTGVVIHDADTTTVQLAKDYVAYADPTDNRDANNSQVFVAALFPNGVDTTLVLPLDHPDGIRCAHALGLRPLKSGERYTYYFGSAWSRYDVRTQAEWTLRIQEFLRALRNPLNK